MTEEKKDRFKSVDKAIARVREEFNEVVDDSKDTGNKARKEVREAIDDLEARVDKLRKRDKEE